MNVRMVCDSQRSAVSRWAAIWLLAGWAASAAPSTLDRALELRAQGKLAEARGLLRAAIAGLRPSGNRMQLARALSAAGEISVALGDYESAIREATEAAGLRQKAPGGAAAPEIAGDFNTLGLANLYLGKYPAALQNYREALRISRQHGNAQAEITLLNNIGNVYYFQGSYLEALRSYQSAFDQVNARAGEQWSARRRQLTMANLATLYQRLGREQEALGFYRELGRSQQAMPVSEQAQLLLNEGALYRRMGDPIKAVELYRAAQALFAQERHRDGEIGALRNLGIARAIDLGDLAGALETFTAAIELAKASANSRGLVQASLYRAETLRRLHRAQEAGADAKAALEEAQKVGLVEERWKALYALGQIAEDGGRGAEAEGCYRRAIAGIESIRTGLRTATLRSEFLADKRDVYDALIGLELRRPAPPLEEVFGWIERSRSRTLQDRVGLAAAGRAIGFAAVRAHLPADTLLLEFWVGNADAAMIWITSSGAGLSRLPAPREVPRLVAMLSEPARGASEARESMAETLGRQILGDAPLRRHLIVVPDGSLGGLPFEVLRVPGTRQPVIERCDVSYLPSAQFLLRRSPALRRRWLAPWQTELVAFGEPPPASADALVDDRRWQPLAASGREVRGIAGLLGGRAEIHLGTDARKRYLLDRGVEGVPLLHFSTHALVDLEEPERSRILLAPQAAGMPSDYVFQGEVYGLRLQGVELVTLSACDTARGKLVRGEGIEDFSRAFLAAGSGATIASLWRVADQPAADFMSQLYYFLGRGQTKAEALRAAKLKFLHSNSELAEPRYWAAFVLNGDGWNRGPRVIPWAALLAMIAAALALFGAAGRRIISRKPSGREGEVALRGSASADQGST